MATHETSIPTRRAILAGIACLPAFLTGKFAGFRSADPMAPKCIRWPFWADHDRAGCIMTPAELARRYAGYPKKLRYALRRLARYQADAGRA